MDPKKLPPAVLLALGLASCDGCGAKVHMGPCLSVVPMAPPQPPPTEVDPPEPPDTGRAPMTPCLSVRPLEEPPLPPEEPPLTPCLEPLPPEEPPSPPPPDLGVCLSPIDVGPCLSELPDPDAVPPDEEEDRREGASRFAPEDLERHAVLQRVILREALPIDVIDALDRKKG